MTNQLHYKNHVGSVFFSENDGVFHGKVIGISDSIYFEGDSVKALTEDFQNAIDEYLEFCIQAGKKPGESNFSVKVSPSVYDEAKQYAARKGLSINDFVEDAIKSRIQAS
ncbi:MAG: type II toxin-antitoxin system HicB family antitoxin [Oscillospiraceae bacterium]|nr:type II toxin-antitoxin system HicB family antitoxin [Oscillospiraceae bacterium]